jgi:hypothetical protein
MESIIVCDDFLTREELNEVTKIIADTKWSLESFHLEETPYWYTKLKSLIQAKLGDKKGAIETAKISLASAKAAKNNDYVKMNEDNIAEWSKK